MHNLKMTKDNYIYNDTELKYPLKDDELPILKDVWDFYFEFNNKEISLHDYRLKLINKISQKYAMEEFLKYESILDKLYWNLQFEIAKLILNKEIDTIPYSLTFTTETNFETDWELANVIESKTKTIYYRSFINKLLVVDKHKKKVYTKDQESSISFFSHNYFNLLGASIMSSRELYELVMDNPNIIKKMKIPLPAYYYQIDYGFPNFSLCNYNINDVNTVEGSQVRLDRINKMFYSEKSEKYWFTIL